MCPGSVGHRLGLTLVGTQAYSYVLSHAIPLKHIVIGLVQSYHSLSADPAKNACHRATAAATAAQSAPPGVCAGVYWCVHKRCVVGNGVWKGNDTTAGAVGGGRGVTPSKELAQGIPFEGVPRLIRRSRGSTNQQGGGCLSFKEAAQKPDSHQRVCHFRNSSTLSL
jgi:hypothetical protein